MLSLAFALVWLAFLCLFVVSVELSTFLLGKACARLCVIFRAAFGASAK